MKKGRLYQSPEIDFKELLAGLDVLIASDPIDETDGGFWSNDYDLSGKWW